MPILPLLAQAQPQAFQGGIGGLIAHSGPVPLAVLVLLLVFSLVSWAIILFKLWTFSRSERQSSTFLEVFRRSSKFSEVQAVCKTLGDSPLVGIFQAGYAELMLSCGSRRLREPRPRRRVPRCGAFRHSTARCCVPRRSR